MKGQKVDIFGQIIPNAPQDQVECRICGRKVAAARFTTHLQKCMT